MMQDSLLHVLFLILHCDSLKYSPLVKILTIHSLNEKHAGRWTISSVFLMEEDYGSLVLVAASLNEKGPSVASTELIGNKNVD